MPVSPKATGIPVQKLTKRPTSKAKPKPATTQTEPCPFFKEENLRFFPSSKLGNDGMRRDYLKAINFINSCHKFINSITEKNNGSTGDKNNTFLLPEVTNFAPLFPILATNKKKKIENEKVPEKIDELPKKRIIAVRKEEIAKKIGSNKIKNDDEIELLIRNQISQFLTTLQEDIGKKKTKQVAPKRNLEVVKQKLQDLSKICNMRRDLVTKTQMLEIVAPCKNFADTASTILSDGDCEEISNSGDPNVCVFASVGSLVSESSDIKSDSELEINA